MTATQPQTASQAAASAPSSGAGSAAWVPSFLRAVTGVGLLLYAVLCFVFLLTLGSPTSGLAFAAAQLFLVVGIVGFARVTLGRAPILTLVTVALLLVQCIGHAFAAGHELIAALSPEGSAAVDGLHTTPWGMAVAAPTVIGLFLGTLLLGVTAFRCVRGAWWIALTLAAWLIIEFFGHGLGAWYSITSGGLLVAGFAGLAVLVWRSDLRLWEPPSQPSDPGGVKLSDV